MTLLYLAVEGKNGAHSAIYMVYQGMRREIAAEAGSLTPICQTEKDYPDDTGFCQWSKAE